MSVESLSRAEYDALADRVNWSSLKHMARSPAHYRQSKATPYEDTDAKLRGRIAHLAVLEPHRLSVETAVWDGGARRGKDWEAFKSANLGKELVTASMFAECLAMSDAVRSDATARAYLGAGLAEVSMLWAHEVRSMGGLTGYRFECKGRMDFVSEAGAIVDLKTARDASPSGFGREAARLLYHGQAAFYVDGYKSATGRELPFKIIAVEAEPPYVVQVYALTDEQLGLGRELYRSLLDRLNLCRVERRWGGYVDGETPLALPGWMAPRDEDDVAELDLVIGGA